MPIVFPITIAKGQCAAVNVHSSTCFVDTLILLSLVLWGIELCPFGTFDKTFSFCNLMLWEIKAGQWRTHRVWQAEERERERENQGSLKKDWGIRKYVSLSLGKKEDMSQEARQCSSCCGFVWQTRVNRWCLCILSLPQTQDFGKCPSTRVRICTLRCRKVQHQWRMLLAKG